MFRRTMSLPGMLSATAPRPGRIFLHGQAGERFAIRNSGATMVVGASATLRGAVHDRGRVAVLGKVGVNFAAGMTGGLAYVYSGTATSIRNTAWAAWTWKRSCRTPPTRRNCLNLFMSITWLPEAAAPAAC